MKHPLRLAQFSCELLINEFVPVVKVAYFSDPIIECSVFLYFRFQSSLDVTFLVRNVLDLLRVQVSIVRHLLRV
tara:strand:+ start:150 stop:371 length:222 start_codon:yes stop_codon:yes gene_type:complete